MASSKKKYLKPNAPINLSQYLEFTPEQMAFKRELRYFDIMTKNDGLLKCRSKMIKSEVLKDITGSGKKARPKIRAFFVNGLQFNSIQGLNRYIKQLDQRDVFDE